MTDPYLIAHKVRGEPAFDIAIRIPCPECHACGCEECDQLCYWWIVPTSGHRAYPYDHWALFDICNITTGPMPIDLPDHYPVRASPKEPPFFSRT